MHTLRKSLFFRYIASAVLITFSAFLPATPGFTQVAIIMPPPGEMIHVTQPFDPPQMVGLKIDLKNPFSFDFIMDQGQKPLSYEVKKQEFNKIIKYFLVSLTMPNRDMWVNLSPYESQHIIPQVFAQTEMGRDLLAQDYILKQFTASLMYPETGLGKEFWQKVYAQAQDRFGTTQINVNNFNKVWIVADHADVYQKDDTAFLVASHLKVMLDQDYMAVEQNKEMFGDAQAAQAQEMGDANTRMAAELVRQIIIPAIEKEVNEGQSFAAVRQIYNAEIMATWYKKTLKQSLLGEVFADKSRIGGQRVGDPQAAEKIYDQYLVAYKQGVYDYIKKDVTPDGQVIPRKYFSGGMQNVDMSQVATVRPEQLVNFTNQMGSFADQWKQAATSGAGAVQDLVKRTVPADNNTSAMDLVRSVASIPTDNPARPIMLAAIANQVAPNAGSPMTPAQFQNSSTSEAMNLVSDHMTSMGMTPTEPLPQSTVTGLFDTIARTPELNTPDMAGNLMGAVIQPQASQQLAEVNTFAGKTIPEAANENIFDANVSLAPSASVAPTAASMPEQSTPQVQLNNMTQGINDLTTQDSAALANQFTAPDMSSRMAPDAMADQLATSFANNPEDVSAILAGLDISSSAAPDMSELKDRAEAIKEQLQALQRENKEIAPVIRQKLAQPQVAQVISSPQSFAEALSQIAAANPNNLVGISSFAAGLANDDQGTTTQLIKSLANLKSARDWVNSQASTPSGQVDLVRSISGIQQGLNQAFDAQVKGPEAKPYLSFYAAHPELQSIQLQPGQSMADAIRTSLQASHQPMQGNNLESAVNGIASINEAQKNIQQMAQSRLQDVVPETVAATLAKVMASNAVNEAPKTLGGISLSDEQLTMDVKVDGAGMPLAPQFQDKAMLNLTGLTSVINKIEPLTQQNVPALYKLLQ